MWKVLIISFALISLSATGYVLGQFDAQHKSAVKGISAVPTHSIESTITPTEEPTPTDTPVRVYPTATPIVPTSTPQPTAIPVPTDNPNKDSLCRNKAELERIKLEQQLWDLAKQKTPEYFSFAVAKEKNPGQWSSQYMDEYYFQQQWAKYSKTYLDMIGSGIKSEAQKAYYQIYNICLTQ